MIGHCAVAKIAGFMVAILLLSSVVAFSNSQSAYAQTFSFDPAINLSNNSGSSFLPTVASSGNNVYVVWSDDTTGVGEILFARSTDGGATFGIINLSNNGVGFADHARIVASGNNVYVIWADNTVGNLEIFFIKSTDGGATFGSEINISNNSGNSRGISGISPDFVVSGNDIYVVWQDDTPGNFDIFLARSTDDGATFGTPINLSNNSGDSTIFHPGIVTVSGNNVYVVWQDNTPGNFDIFLARSTDGGATFGTPINLSNNNSAFSTAANLAAFGNNVYVVWQDSTPAPRDILFVRSTDGGATFTSPVNLSNTSGSATLPEVVASNNDVFVVWRDNTVNSDIFLAKSTDGGATFGTTINLSNDFSINNRPDVKIDNDLYVTWETGTSSGSEIFFTTSTDGGVTFDTPLNVSNVVGNSFGNVGSQLAISGNSVFITWIETTSGTQPEVFFATGFKVPPVADNQNVSVLEDGSKDITLTASDPNGDALTLTLVTDPTNGSLGPLTPTGPTSAQVTYTPFANYNGPDSLEFKANDGNLDSNIAIVSITVDPVNDLPTANNDASTVDEGSVNNIIDALANDTALPDTGETLTIISTTAPDNGGTVNIVSNTLEYTPASEFFGTEIFDYTINDGTPGSNDLATVTVTVNAVNDPPTANNDASTVDEGSVNNIIDVLANDTALPDTGETLTIISTTAPDNGGAVNIVSNTLEYTPASEFFGTEIFDYTINDGTPGSDDLATVTVTVTEIPSQTPTGADVTVSPIPEVTITFSDVTSSGLTTVTTLLTPPGPDPPGFRLQSTIYDISTTAIFSPPITICLSYDPTGLNQKKQEKLKLEHFVSPKWVNIVVPPVDTVNKIICGSTNSLSPFAVFVDDIPPVLTIPADVTVEPIDVLTPVDIGTATATDVTEPIIITNDSPGSFPLGDTIVTWTATDGAGNSVDETQLVTVDVGDGNPLKGQRSDVNAFLTYVSTQQSTTPLSPGTTSYTLIVKYGDTTDLTTFSAVLNRVDVSTLFSPSPGSIDIVTIPLDPGRNVLKLKIDGLRTDLRTATDSDTLVFKVG